LNSIFDEGSQDIIVPPQILKDMILDLRVAIDQIDRNFGKAHELLLEIAKTLDGSKACNRELISRRIKGLLADEIREGKISTRWIEKSLPLGYKRSYIYKSEVTSLSPHERRKVPYAAENISHKRSKLIAKTDLECKERTISNPHVSENGIICSSLEPSELIFELSRNRLLPATDGCESCRIYKEHVDLLFAWLKEDEALIEKYHQSESEEELHAIQHVELNSNKSNCDNLIIDVEVQIPLMSLKKYLMGLGDTSQTAWINLKMETKRQKIIGVYLGKIEQRCTLGDKTAATS
jgi:hypothetical protein